MKNLKQRLLISTLAAILVAFIFLFIFRDNLIRNVVSQKTNHFNKTHNVNIVYKNIALKGLTSIHIDTLFLTTASNDTLLFVGSLLAEINARQLIAGSIAFSKLDIENSQIKIDESKIGDYVSGFSKSDSSQTRVSSKPKFNTSIERLINRVFIALPKELIVKNFSILYSQDSLKIGANIEWMQLEDEKLTAAIKLFGNHREQIASVEGTITPRKRAILISVKAQENETMLNSSLAELFGAKVKYKSVTFGFNEKENDDNTFRFEGNCTLGQFDVDYSALSSKKIRFPECSMKFECVFGENYMEIDSLSEIKMGTLKLHPYLKYSRGSADSIAFSCHIPDFTATDFFNSIPSELFPNLKYIEADGNLSYRTKLMVNLSEPDSLRFESHLNTDNFRLNHINDELLKMDTSFVFIAYEKGDTMRTILVGSENPNFISIEKIPLLLQNTILAAEDIEFYKHKGFLIESIRYALAQNIKERRFIRGGSTISQQLIKNVYLSREKTLSRKFEEIVLVWLIESNNLVSKSRMFEVYLNIIEWGPNVYGVNEASQFYFKKNASQLNEAECIFLASVIPSPKKFYWRFNKQGELAPFMRKYYTDMSEKLFRWQLMNTSNGDSLASLLNITGPAREYMKMDTVQIDSIQSPYLLNDE